MSWTAPHTAVLNETLTSAIWNASVRDDLAQSEVFVGAGAEGRHFVNITANSVADRVTTSAMVAGTESTTSTSYIDLGTIGPATTTTTGATALVFAYAEASNSSTDSSARFSFAVSGATTIAVSDDWSCVTDGITAFSATRRGTAHRVTGLTAGVNTFTMKYLAGSGIASFGKREIIVIPF